MANLLDTINQNSQAAATQEQGNTDETQKLSSLLRAKSGKAVDTSSGVAQSNLGEQSTVAQTNQAMRGQVAPQAAIQAAGQQQQAAQQTQAAGLQSQQISQSKKFDDLSTQLKTDATLSDLERNKGQIDQKRYDSQLNQVAQTLRLQNTQYVDNLQREGATARIDNTNGFNEQYEKAIFDNNAEVLTKNLNNKSILSANDNDFRRALAQMSASDAYSVYQAQAKADKDQALYKALGAMGEAGAGAYGNYADKQDKQNASSSNSSASSNAGSDNASNDNSGIGEA